MGPRLRSLLVGMAAVSLVVAARSTPATAAIDQTPPNLTVNIKPLFVVGRAHRAPWPTRARGRPPREPVSCGSTRSARVRTAHG